MSDRDYWERHARRYDASLRWVLGRPLPRMLELASEAVRDKRRVLEVAANVRHLVPDLPAALQALRNVIKPGGSLVAPTFCHDETKRSWLVSRLLAVSGFPGYRRFTIQSLRNEIEANGLQIVRTELLPGLIPIGFVEAVF